jgi:hypothetical protein
MTLVIDMATLQRTDKHDAEFVRVDADGEPPVTDAELVGACCEVWQRRANALEHSCKVLADNLLDAQRERDSFERDAGCFFRAGVETEREMQAEINILQARVRELEHEAVELKVEGNAIFDDLTAERDALRARILRSDVMSVATATAIDKVCKDCGNFERGPCPCGAFREALALAQKTPDCPESLRTTIAALEAKLSQSAGGVQ